MKPTTASGVIRTGSIVLVLGLLAFAWSSSRGGGGAQRFLDVKMKDFAIKAPTRTATGDLVLRVTNAGPGDARVAPGARRQPAVAAPRRQSHGRRGQTGSAHGREARAGRAGQPCAPGRCSSLPAATRCSATCRATTWVACTGSCSSDEAATEAVLPAARGTGTRSDHHDHRDVRALLGVEHRPLDSRDIALPPPCDRCRGRSAATHAGGALRA